MLTKITIILIFSLFSFFAWQKYDNLDGALKDYPRLADTMHIKSDLTHITTTEKPRNYQNLADLNKVADFIKTELEKATPSVSEQKYKVRGAEYRNIIASFGPQDAERIIVGAHYDVCGNQVLFNT